MPTTLNTFLLIAVVIEAIALFCLCKCVRNLMTVINILNDRTYDISRRVEQVNAKAEDLEGRVSYVEDELDREH